MDQNEPRRLITRSVLSCGYELGARVETAGQAFHRSTYGEISSFFDDVAKDYDLYLENPYWSFSSELLELMLACILKQHWRDSSRIRFLDAGAGTGTWSRFLLDLGGPTDGVLLDMNARMLGIAHRKMRTAGYQGRVRIIEGNLELPEAFPRSRSDLILCLHNVIGMGRDSDAILKNLARHLEPGGLAVIMAPNKRHACRFNLNSKNVEEVKRVLTDSTVKFKADMPEMFCFSSAEFRDRLCLAGFDDVVVLGFPVTVHPDPIDPQLCLLAVS